MLDYIKSELYRVTHTESIYVLTAVIAALCVGINFVLVVGNQAFGTAALHYNTTSTSFGFLVGSPMLFCYGAFIIAYTLYEGSQRSQDLKNTIAYGVSRAKIFLGQCIVGTLTAIVSMSVILAIYIGSAYMLLDNSGAIELRDILTELPAIALVSIAALVLSILLLRLLEKGLLALVVWITILIIIPSLFVFASAQSEVIGQIAGWMPQNFFDIQSKLTEKVLSTPMTSEAYVTFWDTAAGMARCVVSGAAGIIVFIISGILALRRKNI